MNDYTDTTRLGTRRPRKRAKELDHLTRDVLAAEKAGQSYGQWKAAHPITPDDFTLDDEDEEDEPGAGQIPRTCAHCGKTFYVSPSRCNKKYCSVTCYNDSKLQAAKDRAKKTRPPKEAVCGICGKTFTRSRQNRVYCSKFCACEADRRHIQRIREQRRNFAEIRTCACCGKPLPEGKNLNTKYCSKYCKAEFERLRAVAKRESKKTGGKEK